LEESKGRGVESPKDFKNLMEEALDRWESTWSHQKEVERRFEGVRVRRGMNPLYIPLNPRAGHVRLWSRIYSVDRICPGMRPNLYGKFRLRVSKGILVGYVRQGADLSGHFRTDSTWKALEIQFSEDFDV
jgi:hypothetical protein